MKKLIKATIIVCILLLSAGFVYAADDVGINIDGTQVEFTQDSGQPFIDENGRTQVPFRQALEAFGATVDWDADTKTAIAEKDGTVVKVPIGADYIYRGDLKIMNDTQSLIKDSHTYLPIRIVLEAFGADVSYDAKTRTVTVQSDGKTLSLSILSAEVNAAMEQIESMDADMTMNISMEVAGEELDVTEVAKMNMFYDPLRIRISGSTNTGGEDVSMDTYMIQSGDNLDVYISVGDADYTKEMSMNIADYSDSMKNEDLSLMIPQFQNSGADTVNGTAVVKLEGKISKEMMEAVFSSQDFLNAMSSIEGEQVDNLVAADIPMTIWVDTESKMIVKYAFDVKDYLASVMQSAIAGAGEDVDFSVSKATVEMTASNINNATEFTVPANLPE